MSTSTYVNSQLSPLVCVSVDLCIVWTERAHSRSAGILSIRSCPHPPEGINIRGGNQSYHALATHDRIMYSSHVIGRSKNL